MTAIGEGKEHITARRLLAASSPVLGLARRHAQEFPSRTVKIVMGFGPGGLGDIAGRAIGR